MEETITASGLSRDQVIEELMTNYGQAILQLVLHMYMILLLLKI